MVQATIRRYRGLFLRDERIRSKESQPNAVAQHNKALKSLGINEWTCFQTQSACTYPTCENSSLSTSDDGPSPQVSVSDAAYAAIGFHLGSTHGTSAVYFTNGTLLNVALVEGDEAYKNWMKNAFRSSQTIPRKLTILQALFSTTKNLLGDIFTNISFRREINLPSGIENTDPLILMLSELYKRTAASTALNINDVVISHPTFMTPYQQSLLSGAMRHANLTDTGCHPSSDAAIVAAAASEHDCPLPPPNIEDGLSYARQGGAFRILYLDISNLILTARLWHSWDAGTRRWQDWFAQALEGYGMKLDNIEDANTTLRDFTTQLRKLLRFPEPYHGIWVQADGFYVDARVELVVVTGETNLTQKLLPVVLRVLEDCASRRSSPELLDHLRSLLVKGDDRQSNGNSCVVDPVFVAARGAALHQYMKSKGSCLMSCEALKGRPLMECLGTKDSCSKFFTCDWL